MSTFQSLISKNSDIFGEFIDYFFTIEFQSRGNEHEHGLVWVKHAPIYKKASYEKVAKFVNMYTSSYSTLLTHNIVNIKIHHRNKFSKKY
jgi:hypothetical protein